jgi:hypothetical protein
MARLGVETEEFGRLDLETIFRKFSEFATYNLMSSRSHQV